MDFTVEKMEGFQLIGVERGASPETSYQELPKFWDEFISAHCKPMWAGKSPETALEKAVCRCRTYSPMEYPVTSLNPFCR